MRDVLRLDAPAGLSSSFPPDEGGRVDTGLAAAAKVSSTLSELVGGAATAAGVELAPRAMLRAPEFLYRLETSTAAEGDKI